MKLLIEDDNPYIDKYFIEWLIRKIRFNLLKLLDLKYLDKFNNIANIVFSDYAISAKSKINILKLYYKTINSLSYYKVKSGFIIYYHITGNYPGYNITNETLIKLVNYGGLGLPEYSLLSDALHGVATNLRQYLTEYINE